MPGDVDSLTAVGVCAAGRRVARRVAAVLLAGVVAASGCGGDQDSDGDGGQAQELGSLPGDDLQELEESQELGSLPEDGDARGSEVEEAQDAEGPVGRSETVGEARSADLLVG